jgi:hypothetical protein
VTLVEFLAPLKGGKQRDLVHATMYYAKHHDDEAALTVEAIRRRLRQARVTGAKGWNIAAVLAASGDSVDSVGSDGARLLWTLTDTGDRRIRELLKLPEIDLAWRRSKLSQRRSRIRLYRTTSTRRSSA